MENKVLFKKPMTVEVGEYLLFTDRFKIQETDVVKVIAINEDNYMQVEVVKSTHPHRVGMLLRADVWSHWTSNRDRWMTYKLPGWNFIYAKK